MQFDKTNFVSKFTRSKQGLRIPHWNWAFGSIWNPFRHLYQTSNSSWAISYGRKLQQGNLFQVTLRFLHIFSCFWPNLTSHLNRMVISLKFFWKQFDQKLVLVLKKHTSPLISTKLNDYFTSNPSKIYRFCKNSRTWFILEIFHFHF